MSVCRTNNAHLRSDPQLDNEAIHDQSDSHVNGPEERPCGTLETENPASLAREQETEQQEHAAEDLITGDSDDPPLNEESVAEMLRTLFRGQSRSVPKRH